MTCARNSIILLFLLIVTTISFAQRPEAEWRMDECQWTGAAGEVVDSQGNGYDGTAMNGAHTAAGQLCNAGTFDGSTQYITFANSDFNFRNRMAVAAWVKWDIDPATGQNYANIMSINSTNQGDVGQFWLQHDNGNTHFQFAIRNANGRYFVNSTTSPVQGVWYHVVGVYDRNVIRIYVNGTREASQNTGSRSDIAPYDPAYELMIGRWANAGFPRAFAGQIDEAKVYRRRLRDNEVQRLYDRERQGRNWDNSVRTCASCGPHANYRMDECLWTGAAGEIVDSSGNGYNGTAFNNATTASTAVLCQAGTFNRTGTSDYAVLDNRAINGVGDFTFMGWYRTPKGGNQLLISGASSANANSWLLWHSSASRIQTYLSNSVVTYNLPYAINDDQWHHIAWVRAGGTESLYLDGSLVASNTRTTATIRVDTGGLMIGQEQDCVGGCFDVNQVYVGEIDELLFYGSALPGSTIQTIYTNQQTGFNGDGTPRTCPACGPEMDLRMDECSWSGTAGEVTDGTGNGHVGTAQAGATTDGAAPILCRNGVLTGGSHITIDTPFAIGTGWTASMWFQFPLSSAGHNPVGSFGNVYVVGSVQGTGDLALLYDSGGSNLRWMVYDNSGAVTSADFPDTLTGWHQLVFVGHTGGTTDLYLDGSLLNSVNRRTTGNLMYVGTSSDDPTGQTVGCMVDEYKIYLAELTAAEITSLYADESAGLSWDGLPRVCPPCTPVAEYRMDACAWDGTGGEVIDSSGNGYNGTAVNNTTTTADAAICRSGDFNNGVTNQYVTLPAASIDGLTDFTFTTWFKLADSATHILVSAATAANPNALALFLWDSTSMGTYINRAGGAPINSYSFADVADGNWHHLAWRRQGNRETIWLDGASLGTNTTDGNPVTVNALILGQDQDSLGGGFDPGQCLRGQQDEVKFWKRALTDSELTAAYTFEAAGLNWDGTARTCPPCALIAYYEIQHDGSAMACYPERIHIVARDASGNVVTGYTGTITLSTSTGHGTWYGSYSGLINDDPPQGALADPTTDDGQATYTFTAGDLGEVTLFLGNRHVETLTIGATDGTFTATGHDGGPLVFKPGGFIIKDAATGLDIPNQVSGHPFSLVVKAVGIDPATGQCDVLDYNGLKTLNAVLFYDNPATGTLPLVLNGQNVTGTGSSIQLNFVNSTAAVTASYADAGRIWFRLTDPAEGISGDSNLFVAKPWAYAVSADGNPGAVDATGSVYVAAGDPFTLRVNAVVWSSADDTDNNLIPDSGADLTDNAVTPNFGSAVTVTHALSAPAGGAAGTLSGIPGTVTGGTLTAANAIFTEVGVITVSASTADYLGAGSISGASGPVGRFTPKFIEVTAFNQNPGCTAGANPFTYSEQPYTIDLTLTAKNTGGIVTQNYTGAFAKLSGTGLAMAVNSGTGSLTVGSYPAPLPFANGVALFSVTGNRYGWGAPHDPETVVLQLTGSDGDGVPVGADAAGSPGLSNGVSFRYGRLSVIDNFGPSDRNLTLTIQAQYYVGGDYVPNTDDSCTTYVQSDIQLSNWQGALASGETGILSFTTVTSGNGSVTLSAPGLTNEGSVDLVLTAPAWFVFDTGTATFGIYRGDDRFISWQEIQK